MYLSIINCLMFSILITYTLLCVKIFSKQENVPIEHRCRYPRGHIVRQTHGLTEEQIQICYLN